MKKKCIKDFDSLKFWISGKGLYDIFSAIMGKYGVNWKTKPCAQTAYMQEYSGLRKMFQLENSRAIYVWCFVYLLNH